MTIDEIKGGENDRLEFKRGLSKDDTRWLKTVVAFANGRGGRILFGVDSDLSIVGMGDDLFGAKDAIADAVANRIAPMVPMTTGVTTIDGKPIIVLEVMQGMQCPYYLISKGDTEGVYIRYDATTRQADDAILRELRIDGAGKSFDQGECRGLFVSAKDIEKLCRKMRTTARRNAKTDEQRKAVKPVTPTQLVKWGVLVERGGELLPTWAFVLLAGHSRLSPLVKCGIFKGTDRTFFVDRREFSSPVQDQVESAVQYVLEKINMGARFNGVYREDVYEIPPDSIRELIVNAIVHRNYINADASPITVALYDDRLEVTSPGGLVKGMTLEKMKSGYSECRNKALAAAFAYMNLIENWGSGVKRYIREVKDAGLREPEFIEWPNAIRVNVYRAKADVDKGESKGQSKGETDIGKSVGKSVEKDVEKDVERSDDSICRVLQCIIDNPSATQNELAAATGLSVRGVERNLKVLKSARRIRRLGGRKYGRWEVVG